MKTSKYCEDYKELVRLKNIYYSKSKDRAKGGGSIFSFYSAKLEYSKALETFNETYKQPSPI